MSYDSTQDTQTHIKRVAQFLFEMMTNLSARAEAHDASKLKDPEKAAFDELTPKLKELTYGSDEYRATLREMKPAISHHYTHNSHHPEYYESGISGMSLLDLLEMLADWKAAGERHTDGSMERSFSVNRDRFKIDDQLQSVLINTAKEMGWL
jgi:Family of unknown function (DUF5662)